MSNISDTIEKNVLETCPLDSKIPKSLQEHVLRMSLPPGEEPTEFFIIGTAHVSKQSCEDVEKLIQAVEPDMVFLELCNARAKILDDTTDTVAPVSFKDMLKMRQQGKSMFEVLVPYFCSSIAQELEIVPGEEFRVALREADKINATVILGDRPIHITIHRSWGKMSLWKKWHLMVNLFFSFLWHRKSDETIKTIEILRKRSDVFVEAVRELGKTFPTLSKGLIDERDLYMTYHLRNEGRVYNRVVAVVGAGHLPGIEKNWDNYEIDIDEITKIDPPKKGWLTSRTLITTVCASIALFGIIYIRRK